MGFSLAGETEAHKDMAQKIRDEVKRIFSPEFLNRIDDTIVFHSLDRDHMRKILDILLAELRERLAEQDLEFTLETSAVALLIDRGFDPSLGARPLRRALQRYLENPLAEKILAGELTRGRPVRVRERSGLLVFIQNGSEDEFLLSDQDREAPQPSPEPAPADKAG